MIVISTSIAVVDEGRGGAVGGFEGMVCGHLVWRSYSSLKYVRPLVNSIQEVPFEGGSFYGLSMQIWSNLNIGL